MKTHDTASDKDTKSRAAANAMREITRVVSGGTDVARTTAQRKEAQTIDGSPFMVSQRKRMQAFSGQALQRQELPEEEELKAGDTLAQRQTAVEDADDDDDDIFQRKVTGSLVGAHKGSEGRPLQRKPEPENENRTGMPGEVKDQMEKAFTTDFSDVRIHPNSGRAGHVGALAYTQGADVHFAPGQFKPETSAGRQLLGHELAHVVQQRQGRVQPTGQVAGLPVNDSPDLENEADRLAKKL